MFITGAYRGTTQATIPAVIVTEGDTHPEGKHYVARPTFNLLCECNTPKDEAPAPVRPVLHRKMTAREVAALQFPVKYQGR